MARGKKKHARGVQLGLKNKEMPSAAHWRHGLSSALAATCLLFNSNGDDEIWLRVTSDNESTKLWLDTA